MENMNQHEMHFSMHGIERDRQKLVSLEQNALNK